MKDSSYITPEILFSKIEDLAPFSDSEIEWISRTLTEDVYIGSDFSEIHFYEGEIDEEDARKIHRFLEKVLTKDFSKYPVWTRFEDDYDRGTTKWTLGQGRDPTRILESKAEDFRKGIIKNRKYDEANKEKIRRKEEKAAKLKELTKNLQDKKVTIEEYMEKIKEFQK